MYDRIAHLFEPARKEHERHRKAMKWLRKRVAKVQRECPHAETKYNPDPAGGFDSFTLCLECGAEQVCGKWREATGIVGGER